MKRSWMTQTGSICLTIAGIAGALVPVLPLPKVTPWLTSAAILFGGIGGALTGKGIRRRLSTRSGKGRNGSS